MGRERGFLVNSNQVTCTLEVVTMGPPYPQGKRPEPMKPDPLGAAVFWRDHPTFKGDYPPKWQVRSWNTKTSPYPTDSPTAEVCQFRRAASREGLDAHADTDPASNPTARDQPYRSPRAWAPASSPWAWREQPRPPSGRGRLQRASGQQPRGHQRDRCAWHGAEWKHGSEQFWKVKTKHPRESYTFLSFGCFYLCANEPKSLDG